MQRKWPRFPRVLAIPRDGPRRREATAPPHVSPYLLAGWRRVGAEIQQILTPSDRARLGHTHPAARLVPAVHSFRIHPSPSRRGATRVARFNYIHDPPATLPALFRSAVSQSRLPPSHRPSTVVMRIQCDACGAAAAAVVCCADEAALCARCDVEIHAANRLAGKHQRLPLHADADAAPLPLPRCDVCQERPAFVFCVEDRALLCRDCDEPVHVPGTLSGNHHRFLATGIRVGFSSVCRAGTDDSLPPPTNKGSSKPAPTATSGKSSAPAAAAQEVPSLSFSPPSGWAVEDLLQLSEYESGYNKKDSPPLEFKELEWFADIDLFHAHAPANTAAEVPELFASPQPASDAGLYKTTSGARQSKRARLVLPDDDDEDYFIVPDLG